LNETQAAHVLGLQANFWSHIDRGPEKVDRQVFPRLVAIAERGWSPREVRDPDDFLWRVKVHLTHLDEMGVRYHRDSPVTFEPPIGAWTPAGVTEVYQPLTWNVTPRVTGPGTYRARFHYTRGAHRLGIAKVELLADDRVVAVDEHRGETGIRHIDNVYRLPLGTHQPGARYTLRASAQSEGGTDSNGEVFFSKEP
jgi:hexosaminidase